MNAFILVECKFVPKRERHWNYLINMNFYDQFVYSSRCFLPLVICIKYATTTQKHRCVASTKHQRPKSKISDSKSGIFLSQIRRIETIFPRRVFEVACIPLPLSEPELEFECSSIWHKVHSNVETKASINIFFSNKD